MGRVWFFKFNCFLWFYFHRNFRRNKILYSSKMFLPVAISISGVIAYLGMSLFDFPMERIEHQIAFAILMAVLSFHGKDHLTWKQFTNPIKVIPVLPLLILSFCLLFAFQRFQTEKQIKNILTLKEEGRNDLIIHEFDALDLTFMNVDNNGVPMQWYAGNANFNLNRKEEAISLFEKALALNPYNFNVLNNAGTGYFIQNNYAKAEQLYLEAVRINPHFDDAKLNLVACYINTKKWDLATQWINSIEQKTQRSESLQQMIVANR